MGYIFSEGSEVPAVSLDHVLAKLSLAIFQTRKAFDEAESLPMVQCVGEDLADLRDLLHTLVDNLCDSHERLIGDITSRNMPEAKANYSSWEEYFEKTNFWPAKCPKCDWKGSSALLDIDDDTDGDVYCPNCREYQIEECEISDLPPWS